MRRIDVVVDLFWVARLIWFVLYLWTFSPHPCPVPLIDTMYLIGGIVEYWFFVNAVLGTARFFREVRGEYSQVFWYKSDEDA